MPWQEKIKKKKSWFTYDFIRLGLVLGYWASSDLLTNLKTLLLPQKMQEVYACDSVCTKHAKNMTSFPAELSRTVPQCWPQFVCTPGSAGACVCAGNCIGVCRGAVMLSRGKQWTLRVQIERAGGPSALFAYQQMFIITLDLCVFAPALWEKCSMSG